MRKAHKLRELAIQAYWAAKTPMEAKMAGILLDLFAPEMSADPADVPRGWSGAPGYNGKRYLWAREATTIPRVSA